MGAAEHRGPAPHPAPQGLGAARRQRGKISPVLCYVQDVLCVCVWDLTRVSGSR